MPTATMVLTPAKSPLHAVEGACCSDETKSHWSDGLGGNPIRAADQLLQADRLVGRPRGLPLLTILEYFRERVEETPCRPLLKLRLMGLPPFSNDVGRLSQIRAAS